VTESLDAARARNLELARGEFGREILRQEHNRTVGDNRVLQLTREQARTMDVRTYALCLELEPTSFDPQSRTVTYEPTGQPPVRVPYDSMERRQAEIIKAIERGTPGQTVEVDHVVSVGQGRVATEAVGGREREDDHKARNDAQRRRALNAYANKPARWSEKAERRPEQETCAGPIAMTVPRNGTERNPAIGIG